MVVTTIIVQVEAAFKSSKKKLTQQRQTSQTPNLQTGEIQPPHHPMRMPHQGKSVQIRISTVMRKSISCIYNPDPGSDHLNT